MAQEPKKPAQPDASVPLTLPEVTPLETPRVTPLDQRVSSGHLAAKQ